MANEQETTHVVVDQTKQQKRKKRRNWLPLEANPEVLTKYARALGAPSSSSFADVYGLEEELLAMVPGKALALLLLFPITKTYEDKRVEQQKELTKLKDEREKDDEERDSSSFPYFTRQTIGNACGTVGLLHSFAPIAGKVGSSAFAAGSFFERFYSATASMGFDERAEYLESPVDDADDDDDDDDEGGEQKKKESEKKGEGEQGDETAKKRRSEEEKKTRAALAASIDAAHAAAAVAGDTRPPGADEDVDLHFVAFVETGGRLWELDGRKIFPVDHGATSPETLLRDAAAAIKKEFVDSATAEGSINFNLLALVEGAPPEDGE